MADLRYMRDAIHSFISFEKNGIINKIIDTEEFQRLKYIRQLGLSYFTYPSALHSRFSHSLGTYWLSHRVGNLLIEDEDVRKNFEIAALLHDIGHGPFSHALENHIKSDCSHIQRSIEIIKSTDNEISELLNNGGFDPKDISKILDGAVNPKYLHKLISSQLDIDRFDYLLRDSLMSGNPHGAYDIERIIQTIGISDSEEIYVDEGGWYAVEHYLNCRYQMHKQVYYHRTTLAAEELVKKIIDRCRELHEKNEIKVEKKLAPLMKNDMKLSDFLDITDSDITYLIKSNKKCKDLILSDLCKRFFKRELFKQIKIPIEQTPKLITSMDDITKLVKKMGFDNKYYISYVDLSAKSAYDPYTPNSKDEEDWIYVNPECTREISKEIPSLSAIKSKGELLLFLPDKKCKEEVQKIIK
jgi:HD superfamily phosphohydrolase